MLIKSKKFPKEKEKSISQVKNSLCVKISETVSVLIEAKMKLALLTTHPAVLLAQPTSFFVADRNRPVSQAVIANVITR